MNPWQGSSARNRGQSPNFSMSPLLRMLGLAIIGIGSVPCVSPVHAQTFTLHSPALSAGERLSQKYLGQGGPRKCNGQNVSPPLQWTNAPPGTRSFLIMLTDTDGWGEPNGAGFIHRIAYGIPAARTSLAEGEANSSSRTLMLGKNTLGSATYFGPCPQTAGDQPHEYVFSITALSLEPQALRPGLNFSELWELVSPHELNDASLSVRYAGEFLEKKPPYYARLISDPTYQAAERELSALRKLNPSGVDEKSEHGKRIAFLLQLQSTREKQIADQFNRENPGKQPR